jgi:hypothetical protein
VFSIFFIIINLILRNINIGGVLIGFIIGFIGLLLSTRSCNNCSNSVAVIILMINSKTMAGWISHIQGSVVPGFIGLIASAIFYKSLMIQEKNKIQESKIN